MTTIEADRRLLKEFEHVFALTVDARSSYLEKLRQENHILHQRVTTLLSGIDTQKVLAPLHRDEFQERLLNTIIDQRYQVESLVGQGGMGLVYRATDNELNRKVALKIVRTNQLDSGLNVMRFLLEKQVLAKFQHPHIAQIFDSGFVDEHLPYYVMEYVKGVPITTYCDDHRLSINDRLKLFIDVCEAVQAAHQQFIVHQDIKPSNILVSDEGEIKLLDFGIASLLQQEEAVDEKSQVSPFTPAYAAPEQVFNRAIGTYSDVYALGILLHELLVGERPYPVDNTSNNFAQLISEKAPEKPSQFLKGETTSRATPNKSNEAAHQRRTSASRLVRKLRGELDLIVVKALQKKPNERYKTANELSQDIKNYLGHYPISIRVPHLPYRAAKFIQRHKISLITTAFFVILVLSLTIMLILPDCMID